MAAVPVDTFTGLVLVDVLARSLLQLRHDGPRGSSAAWRLSNIKLGGAIMWIGGDASMLLALHPHRRHVGEVGDDPDEELDAILDAQGI